MSAKTKAQLELENENLRLKVALAEARMGKADGAAQVAQTTRVLPKAGFTPGCTATVKDGAYTLTLPKTPGFTAKSGLGVISSSKDIPGTSGDFIIADVDGTTMSISVLVMAYNPSKDKRPVAKS